MAYPLHEAVVRQDLEAVNDALHHWHASHGKSLMNNIDVNSFNDVGKSALHYATIYNCVDIANLLLDNGAVILTLRWLKCY